MMNIGVHVSFQISVFVLFFMGGAYILRNGIAGSYGSSIFHFLRNLHKVSHNDSPSIHSHQQCIKLPFLLFLASFCYLYIFYYSHPETGMRWYLIVGFYLHSLTIKDVEDLFKRLLVIFMYSLEKCLIRSSANFFF